MSEMHQNQQFDDDFFKQRQSLTITYSLVIYIMYSSEINLKSSSSRLKVLSFLQVDRSSTDADLCLAPVTSSLLLLCVSVAGFQPQPRLQLISLPLPSFLPLI